MNDFFETEQALQDNATNFHGKDVIYIELQENWTLQKVSAFENAINAREANSNSNIRYRIIPYGMKIKNAPPDVFIEKAIVKCVYCGQWGARRTECRHCGSPIA